MRALAEGPTFVSCLELIQSTVRTTSTPFKIWRIRTQIKDQGACSADEEDQDHIENVDDPVGLARREVEELEEERGLLVKRRAPLRRHRRGGCWLVRGAREPVVGRP